MCSEVMKRRFIFFLLLCLPLFSVRAQTPSVYCTFWNGNAEYLGFLNFNTNQLDSIGIIPGSTAFPVASANGYDSFRNRYYTLSNQGLVAIDASTGIPIMTANQFAGNFKHLNFNPVTDLLYVTRYNGTVEEFFQVSPTTLEIVNQGTLDLDVPVFMLGFYGMDAFADEVIFQNNQGPNGMKSISMTTGQVTKTYTKPDYMDNMLLAAHDPVSDHYYSVGLRNTRLYLLRMNKTTGIVDSIGQIPGATSIGLAGSTIETVSRQFIFISNLGITCVHLENPTQTTVISYPPGVVNVKGFQANSFVAPIPRPIGQMIRSQFKWVESWQWNGTDLPNTAVQDFFPSQPGYYRYKVRRPDGTERLSSEIYFGPTSVKTMRKGPVLSLDASGQHLIIRSEGNMEASRIFNAEGRCVITQSSPGKLVNISSLPPGVYQLQMVSSDGLTNVRFIK